MALKLYTVVRHDLEPGAQAAQSAHALAALALEYPAEFEVWDNQTIILLQTAGRTTIESLAEAAEDGEFKYATFTEPDALRVNDPRWGWMDDYDVLTAVAFAPNWLVQNVLLKDLPLALSATKPEENKRGWFRSL
jgi:hypothetical protein